MNRRFVALLRKEIRQMLRDRSNLAVGLLLPVVLILLFGYGLSFDVKNAPVAVVLEDSSPPARDVLAGLQGSPYLAPVWTTGMPQAERLMRDGEVRAIVRVPADFSRRLAAGQAQIQLLLNGVDSNTASAVEGYVGGAIAIWSQRIADRSGGGKTDAGGVDLVQRMWFNEASTSTWYLVPGLIALVMTLIGAFLTSLLIAREWERGTLESLFVTPVRPLELVLAKLAPYLLVGAIDLALCLLAARFLFRVPIRGSLSVIVLASLLYLAVSLLLGLFISGKTRNQFQASQVALLASFLPAMMLSGFIFDLRNVPVVVQAISQLLPATHFVGLIKTQFLAGDNWPMILRDCSILTVYALVLTVAVRRTLRKTLD
ncbi:MAG TPA: ABC transporter permease [Burkholderiaceae bacterium]|nr:ABC transporter permease [Burkholderiaceae bacterium]